ncbi:MAG: hypothetical protein EP335_08510 [Alphaproteobacteria bacterium]|nr:MAG: hypothetical protein EP335_08510 [Alphaproteobacteria bacterium]
MRDSITFFKTALMAAFLVVAGAMAVQADDGRKVDEDRLAEFMERMEEARARLKLSPEQETQIQPIMQASREKRLAILEKHGFSGGAKPALSLRDKIALAKEMKAVREDTEKSLSQYLSDAQMKEYRKIQDENRERMKARMKAR